MVKLPNHSIMLKDFKGQNFQNVSVQSGNMSKYVLTLLVFAQQAYLFLEVFETDFVIGYFMVCTDTLINEGTPAEQ